MAFGQKGCHMQPKMALSNLFKINLNPGKGVSKNTTKTINQGIG